MDISIIEKVKSRKLAAVVLIAARLVQINAPWSAFLWLALGYLAAEALQMSAEAFAKAVGFHPDYVPAWIGWGDALLGLNEPDSALLKYQKALELDPNNTTVKQIIEDVKTAMREMDRQSE